jgi:putative oxidoreductase
MKFLIWRILDLIVGGIFVYAGALKILDPIQFANDIDNYKTLPWFVSVRLAFYLPWLEMLCGLALIFRFLYRGGLSILSALTLIFIGATVVAKARGLDITCGCFGHASRHWNFWQHMTVDLAILALLVAALIREQLGFNLSFRFFGQIEKGQDKHDSKN